VVDGLKHAPHRNYPRPCSIRVSRLQLRAAACAAAGICRPKYASPAWGRGVG
jgi:hypothetical protein